MLSEKGKAKNISYLTLNKYYINQKIQQFPPNQVTDFKSPPTKPKKPRLPNRKSSKDWRTCPAQTTPSSLHRTSNTDSAAIG